MLFTAQNMTCTLAFINMGPMEMLFVGIVAVLLFGKRLPEVGRSLGKGLMEFKKGLQGIQEEIDASVTTPIRRAALDESFEDHVAPSAPKFEPPTAEAESAPDAESSQPTV